MLQIDTGAKRRGHSADIDRVAGCSKRCAKSIQQSRTLGESPSLSTAFYGYGPSMGDDVPTFTHQPVSTREAVSSPLQPKSQTALSSLTEFSPPRENSHSFMLPPLSLHTPRLTSHSSFHSGLTYQNRPGYPTIQVLQHENTDLVSAYSSAQTSLADFEETTGTSHLEIAKLLKERQRLKARVDVLKAEVDELQHNRDSSQQHASAKDAQYCHIIRLATRLQAQYVRDIEQHKAEQGWWLREKETMQNTIEALRSEVLELGMNLPESAWRHQPTNTSDSDLSVVASPMIDKSNADIRPNTAKFANKSAVMDLCEEHAQLTECIEKLRSVGTKMRTHLHTVGAMDGRPRETAP